MLGEIMMTCRSTSFSVHVITITINTLGTFGTLSLDNNVSC